MNLKDCFIDVYTNMHACNTYIYIHTHYIYLHICIDNKGSKYFSLNG